MIDPSYRLVLVGCGRRLIPDRVSSLQLSISKDYRKSTPQLSEQAAHFVSAFTFFVCQFLLEIMPTIIYWLILASLHSTDNHGYSLFHSQCKGCRPSSCKLTSGGRVGLHRYSWPQIHQLSVPVHHDPLFVRKDILLILLPTQEQSCANRMHPSSSHLS